MCKADVQHWLCTCCLLHVLELTLFSQALAWCPWQSNVLATGGGTSDRHIRMWNVCSGTCLSTVDTHSQVRHKHPYTELLAVPRGMGKETLLPSGW